MDDRAVNVLENYELKVLRTWKGRGAILCETDQGLKILKEYTGSKEKIAMQNQILTYIREQGFEKVEQLVKNKEDEFVTTDIDRNVYILKDYFEGRECNIKEEAELLQAMQTLSRLHKAIGAKGNDFLAGLPVFSLEKEFYKHNKELKKVRNYIRQKGQKSEFELFLLKHYDRFYEQALEVEEAYKEIEWNTKGIYCHGDYQYHNILFYNKEAAVINFEKYIFDSRVRDIYLFMRKVLEKNAWSEDLGNKLLNAYEKETPLSKEEYKQLYFRFLYPEKFWKIANFYFNSGKAFISSRNGEKLEKLLKNQEDMQNFIASLKVM